MRPGALTDGLRLSGRLELEVIGQTAQVPHADERFVMGLTRSEAARVREVCMRIDGTPCVVARSVLTAQGYASSWQTIRRLGKRPLADLLYQDRRVVRSHFETARLTRFHPLAAAAHRHLHREVGDSEPFRHQAGWARRSVFWREGQPLLVCECFLPAFWALIERQAKHPTPASG